MEQVVPDDAVPSNAVVVFEMVNDIGDLLVQEDVAYSPVPHGIQQPPNINPVVLFASLEEQEQYVESNQLCIHACTCSCCDGTVLLGNWYI